MFKNTLFSMSMLVRYFNIDGFLIMKNFVNSLNINEAKEEYMRSKEMKLGKYPIFRYGRSYQYGYKPSSKNSHIEITPELQSIIDFDPYDVRLILFPEWEKMHSNEDMIKLASPRFYKNYSTSIIPAIGSKTMNTDLNWTDFYNWVENQGVQQPVRRDEVMSTMLYNISHSMVFKTFSTHWDERQLFRFFTMNAFIGIKSRKKDFNYGIFMQENKEELWESYILMEDKYNNNYTTIFYDYFSRLNTILNFYPTAIDETTAIINNIKRNELISLIKESSNMSLPIIGHSGRGYKKKLEETVQLIKELDNNPEEKYNHIEMSKIVAKNLTKSMKKYKVNPDLSGKFVNSTEGISYYMIRSQINNFTESRDLTKQKVRKNLMEKFNNNYEKFEPWELVAFLFVLNNPKYFFNRAGEKGLIVIDEAIDKYGIENFLPFIAETMMDCNIELPTYSDWAKFLKNDKDNTDFDSSLPPSLFLSMMLKEERNHFRNITEIAKARGFVKFVENICEEPQVDNTD